jgi:hypothetical protein
MEQSFPPYSRVHLKHGTPSYILLLLVIRETFEETIQKMSSELGTSWLDCIIMLMAMRKGTAVTSHMKITIKYNVSPSPVLIKIYSTPAILPS